MPAQGLWLFGCLQAPCSAAFLESFMPLFPPWLVLLHGLSGLLFSGAALAQVFCLFRFYGTVLSVLSSFYSCSLKLHSFPAVPCQLSQLSSPPWSEVPWDPAVISQTPSLRFNQLLKGPGQVVNGLQSRGQAFLRL